MELITTFKKQGGIKLLKQYWKSSSLFTAICQFILLGRSRTALEILRLSAGLKTKQKLEKKYRDKLYKFDKEYKELPHRQSNKVWVCWFQGIENAPQIVQKCYQSLYKNMPDYDIILITKKNIKQYVKFPNFILEKWYSGKISHTHMTDVLRLELLIHYGGLWLDATVLCTNPNIPNYYFDSDLFLYQCLKPGRDGHCSYISSWLMGAKSNNKLLCAVRYLCYEYWKENNSMIDYFLLHDFMAIVFDYYPKEWENIVPVDNSTSHILLLRLFDQYNEKIWYSIKEQIPFHKLTYKFTNEKIKLEGTYYNVILK